MKRPFATAPNSAPRIHLLPIAHGSRRRTLRFAARTGPARWLSVSLVVWLAASLPGCNWFAPRVTLPEAQQIAQHELLIHCDFDLPQRHRLLQTLSQLRDQLHEQLALEPTGETIHIYLFDDATRFQKYMTKTHPDFPHRRAFFVKDDARLTIYAHWGERVAVDLRHEVAHGYLHGATRNMPLWLDEGLAEYYEVDPTLAGVNQPHLKLLRQRYQEGTWQPDLASLERLNTPAQLQQIDYAEAWLWVHWMLQTQPSRLWQLRGYIAARSDGDQTQPLATTEIGSRESHQELVEHLFGGFP
jgi:hypothetical protein